MVERDPRRPGNRRVDACPILAAWSQAVITTFERIGYP